VYSDTGRAQWDVSQWDVSTQCDSIYFPRFRRRCHKERLACVRTRALAATREATVDMCIIQR
jgi:hypothetical protein